MDRLPLIDRLIKDQSQWWRKGFVSAFVAALGPKDIGRLLGTYAWPSIELRDALLKSVLEDLRYGLSRQAHLRMVSQLMRNLKRAAPSKRQSGAYILRQLFPFLPVRRKHAVLGLFLQSPYPSFRQRAYALARRYPRPSYWPLVRDTWRRFGDVDAIKLMLRTAPPAFVEANLPELADAARGTDLLRLLVLRTQDPNNSLLEELRTTDEISYVYALARKGRRLENVEASSMFARHATDERVGILIWSFGKMGLWQALEHALSQSETMRKAHHRRLFSHLDPDLWPQAGITE